MNYFSKELPKCNFYVIKILLPLHILETSMGWNFQNNNKECIQTCRCHISFMSINLTGWAEEVLFGSIIWPFTQYITALQWLPSALYGCWGKELTAKCAVGEKLLTLSSPFSTNTLMQLLLTLLTPCLILWLIATRCRPFLVLAPQQCNSLSGEI